MDDASEYRPPALAAPNLWNPDPYTLDEMSILEEMTAHLHELKPSFPAIDVFELIYQLNAYMVRKSKPSDFLRGILRAFNDTPAYRTALETLEHLTKVHLLEFVEGLDPYENISPPQCVACFPQRKHSHNGFKYVYKLLHDAVDVGLHFSKPPESRDMVPTIYEDSAKSQVMQVCSGLDFRNMSASVHNKPRFTFFPTTIEGVRQLVLYAKANNMRIRCSGYRHSQIPTFSVDNEVLVSFLDVRRTIINDVEAAGQHDGHTASPVADQATKNELKSIDYVKLPLCFHDQCESGNSDELVDMVGGRHLNQRALVRVGVAVTTGELRRWLLLSNKWTVATDVNLSDATIGGVVSTICHGSGWQHGSISDSIRAIEYVDANGKLQRLAKQENLQAAAGAFGLLGVITHVTFELVRTSFAVMTPTMQDITLAVPPLDQEDVPHALRKYGLAKSFGPQLQTDSIRDFEDRALRSYHCEWVWHAYQQRVWKNAWSITDDGKNARTYPSHESAWLQWVASWMCAFIPMTSFFEVLPAHWQTQLLAAIQNITNPVMERTGAQIQALKTCLPDALQARQGAELIPSKSMEFFIPLKLEQDDTVYPDLSNVRRAWWDAVNLVYSDHEVPLDLTLELRIVGSSKILLAPQHGSIHGSAAIEVRCMNTSGEAAAASWHSFCQNLSQKWMSYKLEGLETCIRPHWAKEWTKLTLFGLPATEWLRDYAYRGNIEQFKAVLERVGTEQNWTLQDLMLRFSNDFWDTMVFAEEKESLQSAAFKEEFDLF